MTAVVCPYCQQLNRCPGCSGGYCEYCGATLPDADSPRGEPPPLSYERWYDSEE